MGSLAWLPRLLASDDLASAIWLVEPVAPVVAIPVVAAAERAADRPTATIRTPLTAPSVPDPGQPVV